MEYQGHEANNMKLAYVLGWCTELLHTAFTMYDDIMDDDHKRDGVLCWHRLENVGLIALNDAIMIENAIYVLLREYFKDFDFYVQLNDIFHEMSLTVGCGQNMDMLSCTMPVSSFTMERYNAIACAKTAYYNLYMPVVLGMYLAG